MTMRQPIEREGGRLDSNLSSAKTAERKMKEEEDRHGPASTEDETGWNTAKSKSKSKGALHPDQAKEDHRIDQQEGTDAPRRLVRAAKTNNGSRGGSRVPMKAGTLPSGQSWRPHGRTGTRGSSQGREDNRDLAENGDGHATYAQLRRYLNNKAPAVFVYHLVLRLASLAASRRRAAYRASLRATERRDEQIAEAEEAWSDSPPEQLKDKYQFLSSEWNFEDAEHVTRMRTTMHEWIISARLPKAEVEKRIRVFEFINSPPTNVYLQVHAETGSNEAPTYLEAVKQRATQKLQPCKLAEEHEKFYQLCVAEASPKTETRPITDDEKRAVQLVLSQEMEVPFPPRFLAQVMTPLELAKFTDYFHTLEYPLYAHLASGQRVYGELSKYAILGLIQAGHAASQEHQREVDDFKASLSRIQLDLNTRVLTVFFRGKKTASRWINWPVPLTKRMLPLIDYEAERERAKITHDIVRIDAYRFTATVRKTTIKSTEMHGLVQNGLGLKVLSMEHPGLCEMGHNEQQWVITVAGPACPDSLRKISVIKYGGAEVSLHHQDIYVNRPCTSCGAPDHPTKACKAPTAEQARLKGGRILQLERQSTEIFYLGCERTARAAITTFDELMEMMKGPDPPSEEPQLTKAELSPRRRRPKPLPKLPLECLAQLRGGNGPITLKTTANGGDLDSQLGDRATNDPMPNCQLAGPTLVNAQVSKNGISDNMQLEEGSPLEVTKENQDVDMATGSLVREGRQKRRSPKKTNHSDKLHAKAHMARSLSPQRPTRPGGMVKIAKQVQKRIHQYWESPILPEPRVKTEKRTLRSGGERELTTLKLDTLCDEMQHTTRPQEDDPMSDFSPGGESRSPDSPLERIPQDIRYAVHTASPREGQLVTDSNEEGSRDLRAEIGNTITWRAGNERFDDGKRDQKPVVSASSEQCIFVKTTVPTDQGLPLEKWTEVLGGKIIDVAANGQCGWMAFYASLRNITRPSDLVTVATCDSATLVKKVILNIIIAHLEDDITARSILLDSECARIAFAGAIPASVEEQILLVANHYAGERKHSVTQRVPQSCWVGTTQLQAMAIYTREPLFVLDVDEAGMTRMQMYAYKDVSLPSGERVETGTVVPVETLKGIQLLRALTMADILPSVMILRRRAQGNHFQALTYDEQRYSKYWNQYEMLNDTRNNILSANGGLSLDSQHYDEEKVRRAAATALKRIRKRVKARRANVLTYEASNSDDFDAETLIKPRTREVTASEHHQIYREILEACELSQLDKSTRKYAKGLIARNQEAYIEWARSVDNAARFKSQLHESEPADGVMHWLAKHAKFARTLFGAMPYPELFAKTCTLKPMIKWGLSEALIQQTLELTTWSEAHNSPKDIKHMCARWLDEIEHLSPDDQQLAAGDPQRWERLVSIQPNATNCSCPPGYSREHWAIVHVLPFVVSDWTASNAATNGTSRAEWLTKDDTIEEACARIVAGASWAGLVQLRSLHNKPRCKELTATNGDSWLAPAQVSAANTSDDD